MEGEKEKASDPVPTKKKRKQPQRYWEGDGGQAPEPTGATAADTKKPRPDGGSRRKKREPDRQKNRISGKVDPFPGDPAVPAERIKKFQRGKKEKLKAASNRRLKHQLALQEEKAEAAAKQAARTELLLLEEPGFLEGEEGEDTCTISQSDIADAVDLAAGAKHFELRLNQFGPYRASYTRNGRHLLLGGRRGHVAALDWHTKALMCEINVMESINDLTWLHTETMFAVAQRQWLYVYDNQGLELNCLKRFYRVQRMEFLPYHFLLATASETGFLQYLDISVGKEVAAICTKGGRLGVMAQNPSNAIIHLGHSNGTVTLWSPNVKEPLVRMLCHRGGVRALAVDATGTYMATSGLDRKLHLYDLRAYRRLHSLLLPMGAGHLDFSQRGLLGAACQEVVQSSSPAAALALACLLVAHFGEGVPTKLGPLRFGGPFPLSCPVLFLPQIPAELISLDTVQLGAVDIISLEQSHKERVERLGENLPKEKYFPFPFPCLAPLQTAIRKSVAKKLEAQKQQQEEATKGAAPPGQRSALDRFKK
nr:WD repeat-containing protein 46 [Pogona vitticeps]